MHLRPRTHHLPTARRWHACLVICALTIASSCGSSGTISAKGDPVPIGGGVDRIPTVPDDTNPESPSSDQPSDQPSDPGSTLALGSTATIGTWEVTITGWNPDATAAVEGASLGNPSPTNGAYGLVSMSATNLGTEATSAWLSLTFGLLGGDGQTFKDPDCSAIEENGLAGSDSVEPGASISADVCLDIDPASLDGASLFAEETASFDDVRTYWTIGE